MSNFLLLQISLNIWCETDVTRFNSEDQENNDATIQPYLLNPEVNILPGFKKFYSGGLRLVSTKQSHKEL